jgi:hypothetical protein
MMREGEIKEAGERFFYHEVAMLIIVEILSAYVLLLGFAILLSSAEVRCVFSVCKIVAKAWHYSTNRSTTQIVM